MSFSRVWLLLVVLAAAAAAAAVVVMPRPLQSQIDEQVKTRLSSTELGAELMLKLHARKWLDAASQASVDVALAEALDGAGRAGANLDLLHRSAQDRLRSFNGEWKAWQVIAVDARGRVVARAGAGDDEWKDELGSSAVVGQALRGWRLDDVWEMSGKLFRVTASPVVLRDHYAGALLVVLDLGGDLLEVMAKALDADVALLVGGKVAARSGKSRGLDALDARLKQSPAELPLLGALSDRPRTAPMLVGEVAPGRPGYVMMAGALPGEAAAQGAALVVLCERPDESLPSLLRAIDPSPDRLPLVELGYAGGGALLALLIGFLLLSLEHGLPLRRLGKALLAVQHGEARRVDEKRLSGRVGAVARAVNSALAAGERGRVDERGRSAVSLSSAPSRAMSAMGATDGESDVEPRLSPRRLAAGLALSDDGGSVPRGLPDLDRDTGPVLLAPDPRHASDAGDLGVGDGRAETLARGARPIALESRAPAGWSAVPSSMQPEVTRPMSSGPSPMPFADARGGQADRLGSLDEVSEKRSAEVRPAPSFFGGLSDGDGAPETSNPNFATGFGKAAFVPPELLQEPVAAAPSGPVDPLEAELSSVFNDFVDTRQRCGEPIEGVTYDKFIAKLRANREQLMTRYACKGVRFQVYVKDGKAALKATPI